MSREKAVKISSVLGGLEGRFQFPWGLATDIPFEVERASGREGRLCARSGQESSRDNLKETLNNKPSESCFL